MGSAGQTKFNKFLVNGGTAPVTVREGDSVKIEFGFNYPQLEYTVLLIDSIEGRADTILAVYRPDTTASFAAGDRSYDSLYLRCNDVITSIPRQVITYPVIRIVDKGVYDGAQRYRLPFVTDTVVIQEDRAEFFVVTNEAKIPVAVTYGWYHGKGYGTSPLSESPVLSIDTRGIVGDMCVWSEEEMLGEYVCIVSDGTDRDTALFYLSKTASVTNGMSVENAVVVELSEDVSGAGEIYTLTGHRVDVPPDRLRAGFYIVNRRVRYLNGGR
jgi:hypothetical protein